MTADDRWQRVKHLFLEALDQPAAERPRWLASVHGDDELYSEVRALLEAHDSDPGFLETAAEVDPADLAAADAAIAPFAPGTIVGDGRYRIIGEAGRGGMAVVYVAEDLRLPRRVAMKALPAAALGDPARLERFRREAWAAARITHPSVATVYAFEQFDGHPFIVYELVRGRTLRAELASGPVEASRVRRIAIEIARGLAAAHEQGVVHRDLKPENIMVTHDGGVKVLDFGIAHLDLGEAASLTAEGTWLGTPAYMAPEQITGAVDARTDIYALGIVMSEMATGRHPLSAPAARDGSSSRKSSASGTGSVPSAVRGPLDRIIQRCLQVDPAARYASARDLLHDLEALAPGGAAASSSATWWWGCHQIAMSVLYLLAVVAAWEAREVLHGVFEDQTIARRLSTGLVLAAAAAAVVGASLRLNLLFAARLFPDALHELLGRRRAWIRTADWSLQLLLLTAAILILETSPSRSVMLLSLAVGAAVACWLIEPVTEGAAFDTASTRQG